MTQTDLLAILDEIKDPEIPVISIVEMGIVRDITINDRTVSVDITPTYSGCPAMSEIIADIKSKILVQGFESVNVRTTYSPVWTTDWMTEDAMRRMKEYGIAPPLKKLETESLFQIFPTEQKIQCPFCDSQQTSKTSEFGSTACKALYYCNNCDQPFEYFKCI